MSFADVARERGMPSAATLLGELIWDVEPNAAQRLGANVDKNTGIPDLLEFLARLSLVPAIVNTLLDELDAQPMERALIAYDVAARSLLGTNDAALLERIKQELAPLRALGPLAPVAIPRERVDTLINAVRPPDDTVSTDFKTDRSLAALARITAIRQSLDEDEATLVIDHANAFGDAHLPSLAIAFLQILWKAFKVPRALELMVELALDHDMLHALPDEAPAQADATMRMQTYLIMRSQLAQFNTLAARSAFEAVQAQRAIRDPADPKVLVAAAEIEVLDHKRVPDQLEPIVNKAGDAMLGWRYAARVADGARMRAQPSMTVDLVDGFVMRFGNDPYIWAYASADDAMRSDLLPLLSREVRYASHEPHVWRALSIYLGDEGLTIAMELDRLMAAQLTSVFGAPSTPRATPPSTAPSASSPASTHLRELERLLGSLRYATGGLSYYDLWDHGGSSSASDADRAEVEADRAKCNRIYKEAQAALEALVPKLRAEAPREIQAWVEAHDAYLAWVIADHVARGEPEASTVAYAKRDRGEWAKVKDGALVFVEERVDYSQEGKERYRELFGFEREERE